MKSNIIRYLLVSLGFVACVAATNTYAYEMRNLIDDFNAGGSSVHEFNFYTNGGSLGLQYYDKNTYGAIGTNFSSYGVSLDYMANVRSSRMMRWQHYYSGNDIVSAEYVSYPLVGFVDNGAGGITFKYFVNGDTPYFDDFNVSSRAGFMHTFSDGYSCLMNKVYFNAGSFIFMCSDSYRTYQVLAGGYTLGNHILYLDPYNSTNNVWWIALAENKAWSTTLLKQDLSEILYGDIEINQSLLESIFSTGYSSYSVSAGGTNIFPTCGLLACSTQSRDTSSVGFVYNKDLTTVTPDFGGGTNVDSNTGTGVILSGSISQKKTLEEYNSCIDEYTYVKDTSSFWFRCREDFQNGLLTDNEYYYIEDYLLSGDWIIFDGNYKTDNCSRTARIAKEMLGLYPDNYLRDIRLAYNGSSSSNGIDLSYMCGSRPSQSSSSDGVSWWQDILNGIGVGNSSEGSGNVFDVTVDSFKNLISEPFNTYIIEPIQSEYNSGYNLVTPVTCTTTNNTFEYGDYLLYFGVVIIVVVLYGFFF